MHILRKYYIRGFPTHNLWADQNVTSLQRGHFSNCYISNSINHRIVTQSADG